MWLYDKEGKVSLNILSYRCYRITNALTRMPDIGAFNFTAAHILNCCLGVVMYSYYALTKNWIMSNIFGLTIAFNSLEVSSLSKLT
jgi:Signal peptide peptidase